MSDYYLGVDGGQSSTAAVISDADGRVLGWATAGPCNHVAESEGRAKFLRVIGDCVRQAVTRAGLDAERPRFAGACLGMSGGPEDKAELLANLIAADHLLVTDDARIALTGATMGHPGLIVIAGTGSIAFGENGAGETARAGGWGYVFGDEGGAFDIARQALRAILREHEGWGPRTALTPVLLEAIGAADANEAMHLLYRPEWPRHRTARLAPLVSGVAEAGDPAALAILHGAAEALAGLAGAVGQQLRSGYEPWQVSWIGGVFSSRIVLKRFQEAVSGREGLTVKAPLRSPAMGALMLAGRLHGLRLEPAHSDQIKI